MKESSESLRDAIHPIFNQSLLSMSMAVVSSRRLSVLKKGGDRLRDLVVVYLFLGEDVLTPKLQRGGER